MDTIDSSDSSETSSYFEPNTDFDCSSDSEGVGAGDGDGDGDGEVQVDEAAQRLDSGLDLESTLTEQFILINKTSDVEHGDCDTYTGDGSSDCDTLPEAPPVINEGWLLY